VGIVAPQWSGYEPARNSHSARFAASREAPALGFCRKIETPPDPDHHRSLDTQRGLDHPEFLLGVSRPPNESGAPPLIASTTGRVLLGVRSRNVARECRPLRASGEKPSFFDQSLLSLSATLPHRVVRTALNRRRCETAVSTHQVGSVHSSVRRLRRGARACSGPAVGRDPCRLVGMCQTARRAGSYAVDGSHFFHCTSSVCPPLPPRSSSFGGDRASMPPCMMLNDNA